MSYRPVITQGFGDAEQLAAYLFQELLRISEDLEKLESFEERSFRLGVTEEVPSDPLDREVRFADGSGWDPGSGKGYYWYDAGSDAWNHLG